MAEQLFNAVPHAPFFVKDNALRYIAANRAMARLCGVNSAEDLRGKQARAFFPEHLAKRYEALDRQVLQTGAPVRDRLEKSLRARRSAQWLLYTRWPVRDGAGCIVGVAALARTLATPVDHAKRYEAVAAIVAKMQSDYAAPLRVAELARKAGLSPAQLQRDFMTLFHSPPHKYLAKVRLAAALDMLRGSAGVAEVAQATGYSDQGAFTRRFHAAVGMTPRAYRSLLQARGPQ